MTTSLRFVIDTSVCVSALLLPRSSPRRAFDRCLEAGRLLVSDATVTELDEVLRRPKFNAYVQEEHRLEFLATLVREAELINVTHVITECRDPTDNKFLELAISGAASHILTGDVDLLMMHPFRGIPILAPSDLLTALTSR